MIIPTVVLFCAVGGCNDTRNIVTPIEDKIILAISEEYSAPDRIEEPTPALIMKTERIYGCLNYHIDHQFVRIGSELRLNISNVRQDIDRYSLHMTDSSISLVPSNTNVSTTRSELVWRYPRLSFAYYSGTMTGDEWLSQAFDDTLNKYLALERILVPPIGRWPYPLTSMGHYYDAPARFYRYTSEADYDTAGALLKAFSKSLLKDKPGAGFSLVNWRNKYYLSWLLQNQ